MSKYCPICEGEFKKGIKVCPVDHIQLLDKPVVESTNYFIDIYAAENEFEGERIRAFLTDKGISSQETQEGIAQMPVASDSQFIIAVPKSDAEKARRLIEEARLDQVITSNGSFL